MCILAYGALHPEIAASAGGRLKGPRFLSPVPRHRRPLPRPIGGSSTFRRRRRLPRKNGEWRMEKHPIRDREAAPAGARNRHLKVEALGPFADAALKQKARLPPGPFLVDSLARWLVASIPPSAPPGRRRAGPRERGRGNRTRSLGRSGGRIPPRWARRRARRRCRSGASSGLSARPSRPSS